MKKIMLLVFVVLLFVPIISASDWDNKLSYSNKDLEVTIRNSILGLIPTSQIGTIELRSHPSVDYIKPIKAGNEVVMWYDFDFLSLYVNGLGEVTFTDLNTGKEIERDYSFVYWGIEEYEIPIYSQGYSKNRTIISTQTGTKIMTREAWLPYNSHDIPKGKIRIGLKVEVRNNDYVDGVWTIAGKKVKKHAGWLTPVTDAHGEGSTGTGSNTGYLGWTIFNPQAMDLNLTIITKHGSASPSTCALRFTNGTIITHSTFVGNDCWIGNGTLKPNTPYMVEGWSGGASYTRTAHGTGGFPQADANINWTMGSYNNAPDPSGSYNIVSVTTARWTPDGFPTSTLNSPASDLDTASPQIVFNGTGTDDWNVTNMSLKINATIVATNYTPYDSTLTQFPYTLINTGFQNWTIEVCDNASQCTDATTRNLTYSNDLAITLNAPVNEFNSTSNTIIFNGTGLDDTNLINMSFILNGTYNGTNSSVFNNTLTQFPRVLANGFYNWTMEVCDADTCLNATARNVSIDGTNPLLNLTNPLGNVSYSNGTSGTVTWTATDDNIDSCFFEYAGINETVTCSTNTSIFNLTSSRTLIFWVNDTFGNYVSNSSTWDYLILENYKIFNATTLETASETFYINVTTEVTPSSAKFIYNGTSTTATITSTGNTHNISKTIDIPLTAEIKPFFWNITVWGTEVQTPSTNQTVNLTNFTYATSGVPFINISFKNETIAEPLINATISSNWYYWLGGGSVVKTLSYTNTTENLNYAFLLAGVNRTLNTNVSLIYDNSISQQRSFQRECILTNATTEQTLFLLPTVEGVFITFQLVTIAEQVIPGVEINVTKSSVIIETGTTDAAGLKTFFLDPDTTYGFSFFKSGFDAYTTSLAPTQTTFTITLGQAASDVINDTIKGISYFINPIRNILGNNTGYEFNLTFVSSFWALDNFELFLKNSTGTFFNSTSSTTATGGFLTQTLNTLNNTDIIMEVTWTINGNQTNITRTWVVYTLADEGFSIKTFFDDLSTYLTSNMFGLTAFGLGIILFLMIVLITGILSVKFGITSPPGIAIVVFALVAFFDVALGIMPSPVNSIPHFPTIFMAIVFLGTFIKEAITR